MSDARIVGLPELMAKLDRPEWAWGPLRSLMDSWRFFVEREAKGNAPVWRGGLRRSITSERDGDSPPRTARAGTNLFYAPWVHDGTDPHFPPPAALGPWARSKGLNPFAVAHGISINGTTARPFLGDAAEAAERRLPGWLSECASAIESAAGAA